MKKINVIDVKYATATGIQDLYETIDELRENIPDISKDELSDCKDILIDGGEDIVGFVKSNYDDAYDDCVIQVLISYDKFEIIE